MIKLFIVTPSLNGGGAEKVALNLVNSYESAGIEVTLVVFNLRGSYKQLLSEHTKLIDLGVSKNRYALFKLVKLMRKESPTHVLSVIRDSNIYVGLASKLARGAKITFREASTMNGVLSMPLLKRWFYKLMMKSAYSQANHVIANSEGTKRDLVENGIINKENIVVIGNPVLPENFHELARQYMPEQPWFSDTGLKVILNVGRFHELKNQKLLIEAFAIAYDKDATLRLILLGEGPEKDSLARDIRERGLTSVVEMVDFKLNPFPYYRYADLFVLTSRWEGFGNVLVEALAVGTPVISTDCAGGPREILEGGKFGILVPLGEAALLAEAILGRLAKPPQEADQREWMARANQFSLREVATRYSDVIGV